MTAHRLRVAACRGARAPRLSRCRPPQVTDPPFDARPRLPSGVRIAQHLQHAHLERSNRLLRYADDTAMTLDLADLLQAVGELDEDHLAAAFAEKWRSEPERGYGAGTAHLLACIGQGEHWRSAAAAQFGGELRTLADELFARLVEHTRSTPGS